MFSHQGMPSLDGRSRGNQTLGNIYFQPAWKSIFADIYVLIEKKTTKKKKQIEETTKRNGSLFISVWKPWTSSETAQWGGVHSVYQKNVKRIEILITMEHKIYISSHIPFQNKPWDTWVPTMRFLGWSLSLIKTNIAALVFGGLLLGKWVASAIYGRFGYRIVAYRLENRWQNELH